MIGTCFKEQKGGLSPLLKNVRCFGLSHDIGCCLLQDGWAAVQFGCRLMSTWRLLWKCGACQFVPMQMFWPVISYTPSVVCCELLLFNFMNSLRVAYNTTLVSQIPNDYLRKIFDKIGLREIKQPLWTDREDTNMFRSVEFWLQT